MSDKPIKTETLREVAQSVYGPRSDYRSKTIHALLVVAADEIDWLRKEIADMREEQRQNGIERDLNA